MKPLRYLLPVVGEALEADAFDRMIRKGIMKEAKYEFLKKVGAYESSRHVIKQKMKRPIGEVLSFPSAEPAPQTA